MNGMATRDPTSTELARRGLPRSVGEWLRRLMAQVMEGLSRQAINRRVLTQLGGMSDRELRDIGLVRQDVIDAVARSPDEDASSLLLDRRNERRRPRRGGC